MTDQPAPTSGDAKYYRPRLGARTLSPRYWLTWVVLGLLRLCVWLPLGVTRLLGSALGTLFYALNAKRRRIARVNLRKCFPKLGGRARRRILRDHFIVMGQSYLDLGLLAWASESRLVEKIRVIGLERLNEFTSQNRGVILVAPHCVAMNIVGVALAKHCRFFSMVKAQRNQLINWLLNKGRARFGAVMLLRQAGLRPVIRRLNAGMVFYYLPDEDFGPKHSVFAPFFGVPTATLTTVGRLAKLSQAVVIPCFSRLLPGGRGYEITLAAPLEDFPTASRENDAARMNQVFERAIRGMPEQYMWTFKIFKSRPDNARPPYAVKDSRARRRKLP